MPAAVRPFTAFNFSVEIRVPPLFPQACGAAFAECDGLELTMDVKTIREGGSNGRQIRLAGPLAFGQLTLRRGLTECADLWSWMAATLDDPSLRGSAEVVVLAPDGQERVRFLLTRCLPIKLKAPPLSARDGLVAIEELQLAYETLTRQAPGAGAGVTP